ncbi:1,4-dihydroxy-2-naphthoate polyprenyltransferase [Flaviflexus salsibiostraticola]|uniref:1,4-dihydroxy-2-naphthoate octaprenyltransferase n=1 Tax=Flaviflexus salsibiostraticola TaxID=1282737 RepID=A0A3S8Z8W6_9ACTO|nr:1,4-dihydroxy-2-naphthoate polyprenyltransferase [Flaviflexus salsibiostraticola]AZN29959.1 1,4-dihydroxy-2-naphthoate polyprenyltransferase [Flaviflexus salsibiostraticola]
MAAFKDWLEGARLRTLPAAVAPVLIGTGAAYEVGSGSIPRALLAAGVALSFQVGVNFANDYSDGVRGTDDVRTGPPRLTGGGLVEPRTVKLMAFASLALGGLLGLILIAVSGAWGLLAAGVLAVIAAWYYTGGSRPYGYMGLGEVFVFLFFGLMATLGTTWTQAGQLPASAWLGATGVGLIACALLMVNNIRDIPTDSLVGKNTLAVRMGDRRARLAYVAMLVIPLLLALLIAVWSPWALLTLILAPAVAAQSTRVLSGAQGRDLIVVLRDTGLIELGYGLLLLIGLAV